MQQLYAKSNARILKAKSFHYRDVIPNLNPEARLNIIRGLRGVGKTTYILQQAHERQKEENKVLYISLDDFYFLDNRLYSVIETFYNDGGRYLYMDEVHKYAKWEVEVKNAYDIFPEDLKIMITGSSALEIHQSHADLSRRAHYYSMPGLSFREYLKYKKGHNTEKSYALAELIAEKDNLSKTLNDNIPGLLGLFKTYLQEGFFAICLEDNIDYMRILHQIVENTVQIDLRIHKSINIEESRQILALLKHLSSSVPYQINISKTAEKIHVDRNKLMEYLDLLQKADLLYKINYPQSKKGSMSKPDKIYLNNPNLYYALDQYNSNIGATREAFVLNQLKAVDYETRLHISADYEVTLKQNKGNAVFEVGGKDKKAKQIEGVESGILLVDDTPLGYGNRMPLYLLGFLY